MLSLRTLLSVPTSLSVRTLLSLRTLFALLLFHGILLCYPFACIKITALRYLRYMYYLAFPDMTHFILLTLLTHINMLIWLTPFLCSRYLQLTPIVQARSTTTAVFCLSCLESRVVIQVVRS